MIVHKLQDHSTEIRRGIVTIGSFDGVHLGHQALLSKLVQKADQLGTHSVLITFEPHPRHVLSSDASLFKLLTTLDEKINILEDSGLDHLAVIPFTHTFSQMSPAAYLKNFLLSTFDPLGIIIGYDHRFGINRVGDFDFLKKHLDDKILIQEIEKKEVDQLAVSSTKIRMALADGDVTMANKLLGYPYQLTGSVTKGDRIGHTLGYPTANLDLSSEHKLIPKEGIYAAEIGIGNRQFRGMLYIGSRPTIDAHGKNVIEVHIFDFDETIYHEEISINILAYIREDKQMKSRSELKALITEDEIKVKSYFDDH